MIPEPIKLAMKALNDDSYECYIVGGAVRDFLRGVSIHDFDLTTSALPNQTINSMTKAGFRTIIDSSSKYGTVVFMHPDFSEKIEITTFRGDGSYEDNRHPEGVCFGVSLKEDALRRDFTVNSLYMDKDENIIDPNNGQADIKAGIIRAVGDPKRRFEEDALRILRAVRFEAKTGFSIEKATFEAMIEAKALLHNISSERILSELIGIVTAPNGPCAIRNNLEIISEIIPELKLQKDFNQRTKHHDKTLLEHTLCALDQIPLGEDGKKDTSLSLAALLHDIGKPQAFTLDDNGVGHMKKHAMAGVVIVERIAHELKFSNSLKADVVKLVLYHDLFPPPDRISVKKYICKLGADFCKKLFVLQRADIYAHANYGRDRMMLLLKIESIYNQIMSGNPCLTIRDLAINGDSLAILGIDKGPKMGAILKDLLELVVIEKLKNDKDDLLRYVSENYL